MQDVIIYNFLNKNIKYKKYNFYPKFLIIRVSKILLFLANLFLIQDAFIAEFF